ncbi:SulP family inorganic anion transporter [Martelella alba]|uniref:SulP family inorganic anion transporter n=1 Tax=Martelella alba TaxID=2590451 RepID=A0ABY2SQV5_9HYPH|nr:SulP family inorganic anion transporter [Martelella alba]TKI07201.1 SulP family inorganic anion transporter [Martelella alba]
MTTLSAGKWVNEALAGVVTALALVPEVISFSVISGVSPKVSLIASVVLCLTLSILGGRPAMVTAAAGSVALVVGPMVRSHGLAYLLPAILLCGVIQIIFGMAGFAKMMRYIPRSVMTGFVNALGLLILMAQLPHIIGHQLLLYPLFALTVLIVVFFPRLTTRLPAPLIAVVAITLLVWFGGIAIPTVGDEGMMTPGLPDWNRLSVPLNLETLGIVFPTALSMALVGLMETLLTAKLVDAMTDSQSDKTRESWALGVGNLLAGFYGGVAGCAMIGQTMVNVELGRARTRLSTLIAGIVLLLLVTVLSDVMARIPMVVLAGIMVVVSLKTIDWHSVRPATLKKMPVSESFIMLLCVGVTVFTSNLALGVVVGSVMAMLLFARRVSHVINVTRLLEPLAPRVRYRVEGPLFFASSNDLYTCFSYHDDPPEVEIDFSHATIWDASTVAALDAICTQYQGLDKRVHLTGLDSQSQYFHQTLSEYN